MSHLTYGEAGIVGLLQGVTELFPISSLGHSVLIPAIVGGQWAKDLNVSAPNSPYLAFIVGLHVATAIAMIIFFWRDWVRIIAGFFGSVATLSGFVDPQEYGFPASEGEPLTALEEQPVSGLQHLGIGPAQRAPGRGGRDTGGGIAARRAEVIGLRAQRLGQTARRERRGGESENQAQSQTTGSPVEPAGHPAAQLIRRPGRGRRPSIRRRATGPGAGRCAHRGSGGC